MLTALLLSTEQTNICRSSLTHRKHSSAGKLAAGSRRPLLLSPLSFHPSEASTLFSLLSVGFPSQAANQASPLFSLQTMPPAAPFRSILAQVEQHNDDDPKPGDHDVPSIFELPRCCAAWGRHSLGAAQPPASSLANEDGGHEREEDDADMDADAESPMATTSRTASCSPDLADGSAQAAAAEPSVVEPQFHTTPATPTPSTHGEH